MAKNKLTPFARFFIFLVIFTPIALFSASYFTGQSVSSLFANENNSATVTQETSSSDNSDMNQLIEKQTILIKDLKSKVKSLEAELEKCNN